MLAVALVTAVFTGSLQAALVKRGAVENPILKGRRYEESARIVKRQADAGMFRPMVTK